MAQNCCGLLSAALGGSCSCELEDRHGVEWGTHVDGPLDLGQRPPLDLGERSPLDALPDALLDLRRRWLLDLGQRSPLDALPDAPLDLQRRWLLDRLLDAGGRFSIPDEGIFKFVVCLGVNSTGSGPLGAEVLYLSSSLPISLAQLSLISVSRLESLLRRFFPYL